MKLIRQSARPQRRQHLNTTVIFSGKIPQTKIVATNKGVAFKFRWNANERYASDFTLELTQEDLARLVAMLEP
jgi:predicted dithiol-disulfide oxidoreductase (DUF899 family)